MTTKKPVNKKDEIKDVQPIRSLEKIEDMKWALKRQSERDYIMFLLGINTGLRVSDLLNLKLKDVKGKKKLTVKEGKTEKKREIQLTNIYEELNAYIKTLEGTEWLFPSRKGDKPISRIQAYRTLNKASDTVDMPEGIGTHTMRKTFGYWHYKQFKDIAELLKIFNHSSQEITLKYIGITDEQIENNLKNFVL
ncbi:tyrosine-type recombinase/integrase [Peribacillus frigoritolerans]|uniref:tyrosine-type recombinase/integrase n=1 Tax=Peribacillus frigoritolerans TaxID=450367 RepID=UPI002282F976|nr:tyrosine-type recombinase/integrase [Peribacillus frigoritolerans]MCY9007228.1 tyrosine-type recombinase/integrase [Peribacillus frigoritolerans]